MKYFVKFATRTKEYKYEIIEESYKHTKHSNNERYVELELIDGGTLRINKRTVVFYVITKEESE